MEKGRKCSSGYRDVRRSTTWKGRGTGRPSCCSGRHGTRMGQPGTAWDARDTARDGLGRPRLGSGRPGTPGTWLGTAWDALATARDALGRPRHSSGRPGTSETLLGPAWDARDLARDGLGRPRLGSGRPGTRSAQLGTGRDARAELRVARNLFVFRHIRSFPSCSRPSFALWMPYGAWRALGNVPAQVLCTLWGRSSTLPLIVQSYCFAYFHKETSIF